MSETLLQQIERKERQLIAQLREKDVTLWERSEISSMLKQIRAFKLRQAKQKEDTR